MFYYLSLGSNIDPQKNIGRCVEILLDKFDALYIYPPVYTEPEGVDTDNMFINTLIVLNSSIHKATFKSVLNKIEESLGRDKKKLNQSFIGHTCDIDIISNKVEFDLGVFHNLQESYLRSVLYSKNLAKQVQVYNLRCIDRPSTIYFDRGSSNKAIFGNKFDTL